MVWKQLGDKACPSLHVFDDGWEVLASWTDVITALGENGCEVMSQHSITPKEFCAILTGLGFKDTTLRENPNPVGKKPDTPSREDYEKALKSIANLWPIDTSAKIGPDSVCGVNGGRSRAMIAEGAVTIARKALGIEKMP